MKRSQAVKAAVAVAVGAAFLVGCIGSRTVMNPYVPSKIQLIGDPKTQMPAVSKVAVFPLTTSAAKAQFSIDMLSSILYDKVYLSKGFEKVVIVDADLSSKVLKKAKDELKAQNVEADAKLTDVRTIVQVGQLLGVDALVVGTIHQVEELKLEKAKITVAAMDMAVLDARKGAYQSPNEVTPVKYLWKVDSKYQTTDTLITMRDHEQEVAVGLIDKLVDTMVDDLTDAMKREKNEFSDKISEMKDASYKLYRDKKYPEAIAGYQKVLELVPNDKEVISTIEKVQAEAKAAIEKAQKEAAEKEAAKKAAEEKEAAKKAAAAEKEAAKKAAEEKKAEEKKAAEEQKPEELKEAPKAEAPAAEAAPAATPAPAETPAAPAK